MTILPIAQTELTPDPQPSPNDDEYDCVACGACCVADYDEPGYAHVTTEDLIRFSREEEDKFIHTESGARTVTWHYMKTARDRHGNCRCSALSGDVGDRVTCTIYESRPNVCRKFFAGGMACAAARKTVLGISEK